MPKTLSSNNPHLLEAVQRFNRTQKTTGLILIGYGLFTQVVGLTTEPAHLVGGLPFIAVGFFCFVWGDPALLAVAAALLAFSLAPGINPALSVLGPDPVVRLTGVTGLELLIALGVKAALAFTALQQFLVFRFLYGTERASGVAADLAVIPPMVPNRTDRLARWARSSGVAAVAGALLGVGFLLVDPAAVGTRVLPELAGALAVMALGLGLGAAFSPTDERPAALVGLGLGLLSYPAAAWVLLQLRP